jgi:hypothetical protein
MARKDSLFRHGTSSASLGRSESKSDRESRGHGNGREHTRRMQEIAAVGRDGRSRFMSRRDASFAKIPQPPPRLREWLVARLKAYSSIRAGLCVHCNLSLQDEQAGLLRDLSYQHSPGKRCCKRLNLPLGFVVTRFTALARVPRSESEFRSSNLRSLSGSHT